LKGLGEVTEIGKGVVAGRINYKDREGCRGMVEVTEIGTVVGGCRRLQR